MVMVLFGIVGLGGFGSVDLGCIFFLAFILFVNCFI